MQSRTLCLVLALTCGLTVLAAAPSSAAGLGAWQLNTAAAGYDVDVAGDGAGNFVAIWTSEYDSFTDNRSLLGRRYDREGEPLGGVFQVNAVSGSNRDPAVASAPTGEVAVAWSRLGEGLVPATILVRCYDAAGNPLGGEIEVDTSGDSPGYRTVAIARGVTGLVVAWAAVAHHGGVTDLFARRYDPICQPQGAAFRVNTGDEGEQHMPAVAIDGTGNFVVVWSGGVIGDEDVFAQRYGSDGQPLGEEIWVSADAFGGD
ncbi:MAG: hypothetical protein GY856_20775, partial [bacterium]|nr:hypothetical protein [bacterium]